MVQAAAAGRLDFSQADSDDGRWRARESVMVQAQEQSNRLDLMGRLHMQRTLEALYCHPGDTQSKLYVDNLKEADGHYRSLCALHFPWRTWDERSHQESMVDGLRKTYTAVFGDPQSAEVQERMRQGKAELKQNVLENQQKAKKDSEEQRKLKDLLAERRKSRYQARSRGRKHGGRR